MKKYLLLTFCIVSLHITRAQNKRLYNLEKKVVHDTTYIKSFFKYINVENSIGRTGLNVLISELGNRKIRYGINQKTQLGYKINWRFVSFAFGVNIPFLSNNEEKYGQSSGFNFNFSTQIKRQLLLDIYFLSQKSLYVNNASSLIQNFDNSGRYPVFDNMTVNYLGIDADYLFNNKKFTFKAPLNLNERQIKSAGSFTVGTYFFYSQIQNNSGLLNDTLEVEFVELRNSEDISSINMGISAGYGYNLVIKKHGLISASGHIGFGPGLSSIKYENGLEKNKVMLSGRYKVKFIAAYMNDNISAGIRAYAGLLPNSANNNIRIYYETDQVAVFFSYRFLPEITKNKMKANM